MTSNLERTLRAGLDRMVDLVSDGLHPTEALKKVAQDKDLPPDTIRVVGTMYNNGQSVMQITGSDDPFEKAADHPLADPEEVIEGRYPEKPKTAAAGYESEPDVQYFTSPSYKQRITILPMVTGWPGVERVGQCRSTRSNEFVQRKQAHVAGPEIKIPTSLKPQEQEAFQRALAPLKKLATDLKNQAYSAQSKAEKTIGELATYFKYASALPFEEVKQQSSVLFGKTAEAVFEFIDKQYKIKKTPPPKYFRMVDETKAPYSLVKRALDQMESYGVYSDKFQKAAADYDSYLEAEEAESNKRLEMEKGAGLMDGMMGGFLGSRVSELGNTILPSKEDLESRTTKELDDPVHTNHLRYIRSADALNSALTDPRLGPYNRASLLEAYNHVAESAPKVAERQALLVPFMHRIATQGSLDAFDTKSLLDLERVVGQTSKGQYNPGPSDGSGSL